MKPPTKLADDLFPDDKWKQADYPERVALLVQHVQIMRGALVKTNHQLGRVLVEAGTLRVERNGARNDLNKTGALLARTLQAINAIETRLEAAIAEVQGLQMTTGPDEGPSE